MHELRCQGKLHGIAIEPGIIEVKCNSKFCGAKPGIVVLHRFDSMTGILLETDAFRDPSRSNMKGALT